MIIYFSGTGNSRAVAMELAALTSDRVLAMTSVAPGDIRYEGECLIFVFPIYSWGIAPIMLNYVRNLNRAFLDAASRGKVWVVLTCGDETGHAPAMLDRVLESVGLRADGVWDVQMPNNYVLLPGFDVDPAEIERRKLQAYPERVAYIARRILAGEGERDFTVGSMPGLKSSVVYPLFKRFGMSPGRWMATDACVGCRICEKVCPIGNIGMKDGRPKWGSACVSCLACYHNCPRNAVQYGRITRRKGQYHYPEK